MDFRVRFGDSTLNSGRIIAHFYPVFNYIFCSRQEAVSDVISGIFVGPVVHDKRVKFRDHRLNRSREILPDAVGGGKFDRFLNFDNCQPGVASDVISGMAVQHVGMDACVNW